MLIASEPNVRELRRRTNHLPKDLVGAPKLRAPIANWVGLRAEPGLRCRRVPC